MRQTMPILALSTLLMTAACVKQSDHEAVQAELADCQQAQAEAQAAVISWEKRYDRESHRWEQMQRSVSDALPTALAELDSERERIVELVPQQVRSDVSKYLDEYFNTVMAGFEQMQRDNSEVKLQLQATKIALETLGQDTRSIGTAIDQSLGDEKAKRQRLSTDLADVIDLIVEFDQTHLNCDQCPDKIKMRDKSRAALLGFHAELMNDLAQLQTFASLPADLADDTMLNEGGLDGDTLDDGTASDGADGSTGDDMSDSQSSSDET